MVAFISRVLNETALEMNYLYILGVPKLIVFGALRKCTFKLDEEWLDFVINNRLGIDSQKKYDKYDILIGPTAENKVFDTVNEYIKGT